MNGRARSGGRGGEGVAGGASGFVLVILPPPGAGGGGERSERGEGWGLGSAQWRHSMIMINSYLFEQPWGRSAAERSGAKRRPPWELENWRAYLFIIVLMAKQARAERRRQGAKGGTGSPRALAEELGRYFFSFHGIIFSFHGICLFSTPPAGGAGGSELSARARPER